MIFQTLAFWFVLLLYLVPLLIVGIVILWKTCSIDRLELLIPAGSIFGLSLFVFLINAFSFLMKGIPSIIISYSFLILAGFLIFKIKTHKIKMPPCKVVIFALFSGLVWAILIFWKGAFALVGSDTNLYYGIAHTFIKGNFPLQTPWQPDLPLAYHYGAFELLGAFYYFTNLSFRFLHVFFATSFIFLSSQIIIWIWKRHDSFFSFLWANLTAAVVLISFGFIKIALPIFPLKLPGISNINQLILWLRDLPTVNQSIEVYGAAVNLDSMIYFIFHSFGFALFLSLLVVLVNFKKENSIRSWIILALGFSSLALINESVFIATSPVFIISGLVLELKNKSFLRNIKFIVLLLFLMSLSIIFQGGVITNALTTQKQLEQSFVFFPKNKDLKNTANSYHYYQQISKKIPSEEKWLPFSWYHLGVDSLILLIFISLLLMRFDGQQKIIILVLFFSGILSLYAYDVIVPKFIVANGNRLLVFAFLYLSICVMFCLQNLLESLKNNFIKNILIGIILLFVIFPTVLPPLAVLSKTRFGENQLVPSKEKETGAISWMKNNLPFNNRVMVLDTRAPHPSGVARALVQAGVFTPIFPSEFRAYTIEASPEYMDIAYYLSPQALKKLGVEILLIDNTFFETLPVKRKQQLKNNKYFEKIFEYSNDAINWEKIYKVKNEYLESGGELDGTFAQFQSFLFTQGKIYVDNEENFIPSFLRRPLIFSLRDKNIYYLPQSGVYLNVETNINFHPPREDSNYDYLILGENTDPQDVCKCRTELVWKGIKDKVFVFARAEAH